MERQSATSEPNPTEPSKASTDQAIQSPHDRLLNQTLQQIESARTLLARHPVSLIQMLGYVVRIWENCLANGQPLVPIIPWVIYHGVGPWRSSRSLAELIPVPKSWRRHVPALELTILDVSRMDDLEMRGEPIL